MEKKNGLSDEQVPFSTFGAVLRSQPAELSEYKVLAKREVAPIFAGPQAKDTVPLSAGGTGNVGCTGAGRRGAAGAAGPAGAPGGVVWTAGAAGAAGAAGVAAGGAVWAWTIESVRMRAKASREPDKLRMRFPYGVE
jgi:hypothetical protein